MLWYSDRLGIRNDDGSGFIDERKLVFTLSRATSFWKRTPATNLRNKRKHPECCIRIYYPSFTSASPKNGVSIITHEEARTYGQSVKRWPAFSDSVEALAYLKQHFKLIILSNVDNASFAYSNARLQVKFDAVYTAEDCGSYKPSDRNFNYFLDRLAALGLERKDILQYSGKHVP